MMIRGRAWKYGNNVDTDVIIPARYLNSSSGRELAAHCMEDIDPGFAGSVKPGDIIVAGENFGCGSSREHAAIAIKQSGIACVIATSFARIFYRNAINIGLPILESEDAAIQTKKGDELEITIGAGLINNLSNGRSYEAVPYPEFMLEIINSGGLVFYLRKQLELRSKK